MNRNKLREMREEELEKMIRKTEKYLPNSLTIYNFLSIGFRRKIINTEMTKVYVPENEEFPCFIIITEVQKKKENRNKLSVFWNPDEVSTEEAKILLRSLPHWSWEVPVLFSSVPVNTLTAIKEILLGENGLSEDKLLPILANDGYAYTFPDKSFQYSYTIPEDIYMAPLNEDDAPLVHKHWVYKFANTVDGIREDLKHMPSVAAYAKIKRNASNPHNNESGEHYIPVAWAICKVNGEIGYTFTLPEYRNMGLSSAVTYELTKKVLEMNLIPFVNICGYNPASIKAHEKIGFKKYSTIGYHIYVTPGMKVEDY